MLCHSEEPEGQRHLRLRASAGESLFLDEEILCRMRLKMTLGMEINKTAVCHPGAGPGCKRWDADLKPFFGRRWEYAGSKPTGCGSQPLLILSVRRWLVTPPGTCAMEHGFHCPYGMIRAQVSYPVWTHYTANPASHNLKCAMQHEGRAFVTSDFCQGCSMS